MIRGVLETVLYAEDLGAVVDFYRHVLGLRLVSEMGGLSVVFRVSDEQVLLVFDPRASEAAGRAVPSHGARGAGHVAFRIEAREYEDWMIRLRSAGVAIEQEEVWTGRAGDDGRSIYVRDPAGNSVELITADIWGR